MVPKIDLCLLFDEYVKKTLACQQFGDLWTSSEAGKIHFWCIRTMKANISITSQNLTRNSVKNASDWVLFGTDGFNNALGTCQRSTGRRPAFMSSIAMEQFVQQERRHSIMIMHLQGF